LLVIHSDLGSAKQIEVISPEVRLERDHAIHAVSELKVSNDPAPDIVLITLDAARADHFGCYGYSRPTTPHIDSLAGESLVFRNATALAPYTLCSVPTMLSGLSFLDHGIVEKGFRIDDQAHTLAEYLQEAGYRTVCFTSIPNNSRKLGLDQGYDEFYEVWRILRGQARHDPFQFNKMVLERLANDDSSRPLHLQLHYLPPHEPYDPPESFDMFGDPDYQGAYDGTLSTKSAVNSREIEPDAADIERIEALYDGNLRVADFVVGEVLKALRARPSWHRTVVLITADHAEAMYEHGLIGHNYTVYDDMLRVPFILRLPKRIITEEIDTGRLVSLADIVPTLLATVPIAARPGLAGVNLLTVTTVSNRYLVIRNTKSTAYALRTDRWKVIVSGKKNLELYDLRSDPGEQLNLAIYKPLFTAGLVNLLQWQLRNAPEVTLARPQADMNDEEERAMLKELGYLE
jgi:arylsulfatase A-like enzyme